MIWHVHLIEVKWSNGFQYWIASLTSIQRQCSRVWQSSIASSPLSRSSESISDASLLHVSTLLRKPQKMKIGYQVRRIWCGIRCADARFPKFIGWSFALWITSVGICAQVLLWNSCTCITVFWYRCVRIFWMAFLRWVHHSISTRSPRYWRSAYYTTNWWVSLHRLWLWLSFRWTLRPSVPIGQMQHSLCKSWLRSIGRTCFLVESSSCDASIVSWIHLARIVIRLWASGRQRNAESTSTMTTFTTAFDVSTEKKQPTQRLSLFGWPVGRRLHAQWRQSSRGRLPSQAKPVPLTTKYQCTRSRHCFCSFIRLSKLYCWLQSLVLSPANMYHSRLFVVCFRCMNGCFGDAPHKKCTYSNARKHVQMHACENYVFVRDCLMLYQRLLLHYLRKAF